MKARKPAAVARAATRICPPLCRPAPPSAAGPVPRAEADLAEADGELDGEIHRQAHEQHGEGDRHEVQRAHRQRRESRRQVQPEQQRQHDRHHQPPGSGGDQQPDRHQQQAGDQPARSPLRHRRELVIVERHRPGDAHPRRPGAHELQPARGVPDGLAGRLAGLQGAEIQHGLGQHEAIFAGQRRDGPGQQHLPGQRPCRVGGGGQRPVEPLQRGRERRQVGLPALHALGDQRERRDQPAQAGVGGELAEEGLRVDRLVQQLAERLDVQEQQRVARQVGRRVRPAHDGEVARVAAQRLGKRGGRRIRLLRDRRIDDRHQEVLALRERGLQLGLPLLPGQGGGEQRPRVGGDAEPLVDGGQAGPAEQHRCRQHQPGMARAPGGDAAKALRDHSVRPVGARTAAAAPP